MGKFSGGGLIVKGERYDIKEKCHTFDGREVHETEAFEGERRVLVAFTAVDVDAMKDEEIKTLDELGFVCGRSLPAGDQQGGGPDGCSALLKPDRLKGQGILRFPYASAGPARRGDLAEHLKK